MSYVLILFYIMGDMERNKQLANVAFGGDWSESIPIRENVAAALAVLRNAVDVCDEVDPRSPAVLTSLQLISDQVTRGRMLARTFTRASGIPDPAVRRIEMTRVLRNLEAVLGMEGEKYI